MHILICLLLTVENAISVGVGSPLVAVPIPPEDEWARRVFGEEREEGCVCECVCVVCVCVCGGGGGGTWFTMSLAAPRTMQI